MLNKKDLEMLRKQYPAEHYEIKETGEALSILPKKSVIRVFKKQLRRLNLESNLELSQALTYKMENGKLGPEDFEQTQVTVEKRVADLLTAEAKKCRTRKIIYLQHLLGGLK